MTTTTEKHKMEHDRPLAGRVIASHVLTGSLPEDVRALMALGAIPAMAGGATSALVSQPDPYGVFIDATVSFVIVVTRAAESNAVRIIGPRAEALTA